MSGIGPSRPPVAPTNSQGGEQRPHTHTVVRELPPTKPPTTPLEAEIADLFVRIEINYTREGTGHGSRFEGERLEVVQARAAIRCVLTALGANACAPPTGLVHLVADGAAVTSCCFRRPDDLAPGDRMVADRALANCGPQEGEPCD